MEPTLAEIRMFAGNFAPRGWALCNGQILPISQNQALFSIIGTVYGGDGRTTFALPDMRGRIAFGPGYGPGLTNRPLGQRSGSETNTMTQMNLPAHNHIGEFGGTEPSLRIGTDPNSDDPSDTYLANSGDAIYNSSASPGESLGQVNNGLKVKLNNTGNSQSYNNMQPYQTVNFIIAIQGLFPSRN